jgi:hypothetical protein
VGQPLSYFTRCNDSFVEEESEGEEEEEEEEDGKPGEEEVRVFHSFSPRSS